MEKLKGYISYFMVAIFVIVFVLGMVAYVSDLVTGKHLQPTVSAVNGQWTGVRMVSADNTPVWIPVKGFSDTDP